VVNRSELDHGKTGDSLEIAEVQRRDFVAEMQRCRADQQILERKLDAHRFLLAFDAPGYARARNRQSLSGLSSTLRTSKQSAIYGPL